MGSRCSILSDARSACPPSNTVAFMRVAIVTGAARGIGAAIARRLAADGMAVGVVDRDAQGSARTANAIIEDGGSAVAVGADVAARSPLAPMSRTNEPPVMRCYRLLPSLDQRQC